MLFFYILEVINEKIENDKQHHENSTGLLHFVTSLMCFIHLLSCYVMQACKSILIVRK